MSVNLTEKNRILLDYLIFFCLLLHKLSGLMLFDRMIGVHLRLYYYTIHAPVCFDRRYTF